MNFMPAFSENDNFKPVFFESDCGFDTQFGEVQTVTQSVGEDVAEETNTYTQLLEELEITVDKMPEADEGGLDINDTDVTLKLEDGVLSVNTTDEAKQDDPRPITAQGVYNEFAVINALLETI